MFLFINFALVRSGARDVQDIAGHSSGVITDRKDSGCGQGATMLTLTDPCITDHVSNIVISD